MKTFAFTLFLALISVSAFAQPDTRKPATVDKSLTVNASLPLDANGAWTGDPLTVTLRNTGTQSVKIVSRLAMGYPERDDSELYVLITTQSTEEQAGTELADLKELVDFHATPVSDTDFKWLNPGETATVEVDLREWYGIPTGDMELQVVYSGDHAVNQDPELLRGEYRSNKVRFTHQSMPRR